MRKISILLVMLFTVSLMIGACGKKNPTAPTLADVPNPTATATPDTTKSTVMVKTVCGTNPLTNITCALQFGGGELKTKATDSTGTAAYSESAEGNFTITVPAQVDILETKLSGHVVHGQVNTTIFQAGGVISVTPTAVKYEKTTGGTYNFIATYHRGAYSLKTQLHLAIANIPSAWTVTCANPVILDGQSTTISVTIPAGSGENATNLMIRGSANGTAIQIDSPIFKIYSDWASFKVKVSHNATSWSGIPITVYDSNDSPYNGVTLSTGEAEFVLNALGNYRVDVYSPENGIDHSIKTGTVVQGANPDVYFNGTPGTMTISPGNINYIYEAGNYANTITYTGTGDLKYMLNLTHSPTLPHLGSAGNITGDFSQATITAGQTASFNYHVNAASQNEMTGNKITGAKPGTNPFPQVATYNIVSDWWARPVLSCGTSINMYKIHSWEDEWYSNQNISYTIEGHNIPSGANISVTTLISMPGSWPYTGWSGSGQLGTPGWKYWHSIPDPSGHNMSPFENNSISAATRQPGASVSWQIHGYRNPYYGESLSGDGSITIRAVFGEKTRASVISLNY